MFRNLPSYFLACLLSSISLPVAYAQLSLQINSPKAASTISGLSADASITVTGVNDLSRLQLRLNNQDVAAKLISSAQCKATTCTAQATLGSSDGLKAGSNYLAGTMSTTAGAVAVAHTRFNVTTGLGATQDPSAILPTSIHLVVNDNGVTFSNFPGYSGTVNYPGDLGLPPCPSSSVDVLVLNPATLQPAPDSQGSWSFCFSDPNGSNMSGVLQSNFTPGSLVIAYSPGGNALASQYDFSAIGGPSQPDAADANAGLSIIGVLGAKPGTAFISYDPAGVSNPLDGVLEQVSTIDDQQYVFRQADAPSLTITPGTANNNMTATFQLGYRSINWGNATLANYELPPAESQFIYNGETFACPNGSLFAGTGGVCVFYLDRRTLAAIAFKAYPTHTESGREALSQDLTTIPAQQDAIVLFATTGNAFDAAQGDYITADLAIAVQNLGASRNDLNALLTSPNNSFSFVGSLDGLPITTQTYATTLHGQQQESGVLHALLERNHQNLFTATQVVPLPNGVQLEDATRSDIPIQVGLARPVPWPLMDTPGHIAAYHSVSHYILQHSNDSVCVNTTDPAYSLCDVRSHYGSSTYNGDLTSFILQNPTYTPNSSYTSTDFTDAVNQLQLEANDVIGVFDYFLTDIDPQTTSNDLTTSLALTSAANAFATDLNAALGAPVQPSSGSDNLQLLADGLDTTAAVLSVDALIPGPQEPIVAVLAGLCWLGSAAAQEYYDSQPSQGPASNPFVTQLNQLQTASDSVASNVASNYATALAQGSSALQGRIYGDWYKLQTFGVLVQNSPSAVPDSVGFYYPNTPQPSSYYSDAVTLNARKLFALQILPKYYSILPALGQAPGFFPFTDTCERTDGSTYTFPTITDYSYGGYPSIMPIPNPQQRDFFLAFTSQPGSGNVGFWSSSFGDQLMAPPNPNDDATVRSLNISQTWFYDSGILPSVAPCESFFHPSQSNPNRGGNLGSGAPLQQTSTTIAGSINADGSLPVVATVTGVGGGTPTGTVTFAGSTASLATALLIPSSTAGTATATYTIPASALPFKGGPLTASYSGDNFFAPSQSTAFTVPAPTVPTTPVTPAGSFALHVSQFSAVLTANGYVTTNLTVAPTNDFTGQIALTCAASPVSGTSGSVTCTVMPGSVTLDGHSAQTAEIVLQPTTANTAGGKDGGHPGFLAGGAGSMLSLMFFLLPGVRNSRRMLSAMMLAFVSMGTLLTLSGCGTSSSNAEAYQVQVMAKSGSQTQTSSFQVSIR